MKSECSEYEDIINLPNFKSKLHPQMPIIQRAAQFAPFSALGGLDEAIQKEIDANQKDKIDYVEYEE